MAPVVVDPGQFHTAAFSLAGANTGVIDAMSSLSSTLGGCTSMAGSDSGGTTWASSYDTAARSCLRAGIDLGNNLGDMATLLSATGGNHARAEAASTAGGSPGGPDDRPGGSPGGPDDRSGSLPATESLYAPDPPSAAGGTGGEP